MTKTEWEMRELGLGEKSLSEIQKALSTLDTDLQLGMRIKNWPLEPEQIKELTEQLKVEEKASKPLKELSPLFVHRIDESGLSKRIQNKLTRAGIIYVGDLITRMEWEIRELGLGERFLSEIQEMLSTLDADLQLGMRVKNWPPEPEQIKKLTEQLEMEKGIVKSMAGEDLTALLALPIDVLKLPFPLQLKMKAHQIRSIKDLVTRKREKLLLITNLGRSTLTRIEEWLITMGLHLEMDFKLKPEEDLKPLFVYPINSLNLSERVQDKLTEAGIIYVGDLITKMEWRLRKLGFNKKSLTEIKETLSALDADLQLGMRVKNWPPEPEQIKELTEQLKTGREERIEEID